MKTPKILNELSRDNICYFESASNYTFLHLKGGSRILSGYTIKHFQEILSSEYFVRINRSKFINIAFIRKTVLQNNAYAVQLKNGQKINISRRRLEKIKVGFPNLFDPISQSKTAID
ncbi:LytTR family transcriptional regulator [Lacihabitans sp. CCS-44]|uniref:LytR/AlgR family response regulator transcription factor n=1 Tax=Lacihabitans sp. CCS-44 TaxID=2487331 RepID=UPI0020CDECB8|nr:LytTR family DNA-binding domain-containing protein [Lacihabitans sp. CCS-44]MCP9754469.1 LytTR family transcriptional regulator [Lacihabitans sp. CCS-44]